MSYQKCYNRINWQNYPSEGTPINESNLNKMDYAVDELDKRIISLDTTKLDKITAASMVKDVSFDELTGVFTIAYLNGATVSLDTKLEKLAVNFSYDAQQQRLIISLDDGTVQYVDLSALITQYEFTDSSTAAFSVDSTGKVSVIVKEGSIQEKHLQPNYLADIKVEVAKAQTSASEASTSAAIASMKEGQASESAEIAKTKAAESAISASNSAKSEENANTYSSNANSSKEAAAHSADSAASSAASAIIKASESSVSATNASSSALAAAISANSASSKADAAANSARMSESYAVGTDGVVRENDSADNAKFYKEQAERIAEGLKGSLLPMGTILFAALPDTTVAGYMFNISDEFTTTDRFKEGEGHVVPAGTNVYYTADGYWDCMAGSPVTGVKGAKESSYRRGNVNITAENVGAQTPTGDTRNNTVTFTSADSTMPAWTDVSVLSSGEKHSSILQKISAMFKNVRQLKKLYDTLNNGLSTHKSSGDHDGRYYTETEVNNLLNKKQNSDSAINTGNIANQSVNYANSAGNADTLDGYHEYSFLKTDASCNKNWNWSGGAEPTWLWGSNDGHNMYVCGFGTMLNNHIWMSSSSVNVTVSSSSSNTIGYWGSLDISGNAAFANAKNYTAWTMNIWKCCDTSNNNRLGIASLVGNSIKVNAKYSSTFTVGFTMIAWRF